jgi:hypothetical protein
LGLLGIMIATDRAVEEKELESVEVAMVGSAE